MKALLIAMFCLFALGCGGAVSAGSRRVSWNRTCLSECRDSVREVRILERDGRETVTRIAIITISPPYVCRCD